MKRNKALIFSGFFFVLPFFVSAQAVTKAISFNRFLDQVKNEYPLSKKANNILLSGEYKKKAGAGFFDPQVEATTRNKYFQGGNYFSFAEAELKQGLFAGQSIKAGYELGQGQYVNGESKTPVGGLSYLGLEVSLLQGMMMDKRRYELLKGRQYKQLSESESRMLQNDLFFEASTNYIKWLADYTLTDIHKRFLETAESRFKALVDLTDVGERPAIDTIEADLFLQTRLIDYNNALVERNKSVYQLNGFIWQNDTNQLTDAFKPAEELSQLEFAALSQFLRTQNDIKNNNPTLVFYKNKGELLQIEKRYRAEQIKPKLDIKYNLLGFNTTSEYNTQFYNNNYKWGLGFSMPLLLRNSVNNYKIAKLDIENNNFEIKTKSAELDNKLVALQNNLKLLVSQIEIAKNMLQYSKLLLGSEKIRFENNESSLFLLNTRESKVLESEIKLAEVQVKFILNYFYLIYLKGDLNYAL